MNWKIVYVVVDTLTAGMFSVLFWLVFENL